ncbi:MAG: hypothetical protein ACRDHO_16335 [Actinomycetota bacterium]
MVRSESSPRHAPPAPADGLVTVVEIAAKLMWVGLKFKFLLIVWAVLFPMLSLPILLTVAAGEQGGSSAATAVGLASLMVLAGWRLRHPGSFYRLVSGRIWKRWRRWRTYRRPWRHLCAMHGLTVVLNDHVSVPKLHRVRIGYASDAVTVRMLYGQTIEDWQRVSDALGHAFGAMSVRVRELKPGWAVIDVHHSDALASVVPLPKVACSEGIGVDALTAGVTERGDRWQISVRGRHILVAGATGAGKGSVVWSVLAGLGPAIRAGLVQLWVIDPRVVWSSAPVGPSINDSSTTRVKERFASFATRPPP